MTKKPQLLLRWDIYRAAAKARLIGTVEVIAVAQRNSRSKPRSG
jgi:hypothetical protein